MLNFFLIFLIFKYFSKNYVSVTIRDCLVMTLRYLFHIWTNGQKKKLVIK